MKIKNKKNKKESLIHKKKNSILERDQFKGIQE